ncbi:MAG: tetratricopeptide repeat protein [Candidatus Pacebacteria bacterium]|nr:tetratricopeptide repeat protein [Candidatus Paceibacterota bacterium]MBP9842431.1 tetratricopeptide repeat protein [Candidatus Paceibacterota bacterium]
MSGSLFTPKVYQSEQSPYQQVPRRESESPKRSNPDKIGSMILRFEQYLVIALLFLIPVFFVPGLPASLGFDKAIIAVVIGMTVVILTGLSSLRYSQVSTVLPRALIAFWGVVVVAFLSALISGDIQDALRGNVFESQTAGFFAVMGLVMTIPLVLQRSKIMSLKALIALGASSAVAILYTIVRLFIESPVLNLGSFNSITVSPTGSFNDLAILAALTVIIGLVTLIQLPLKKSYEVIMTMLIALSLVIMGVVNFFNLWVVVGFFGLLLLVYVFSRDTLFGRVDGGENRAVSLWVIGSIFLVCVVSAMFVVAGDYLGARISTMTGVNYIEVRPSVTATIDIARGVYSDDILLGTGPNRFADAWRIHKDRSINETIFWNTDFNAGFGFVPTLFITLGILGGIAILAFHALYIYLGYRMLLRADSSDSFWYYFGVVTYLGAVFLWGISYVYVSGAVILLLAAMLTGLSFVAYQALVSSASINIALVSSRRRGFFLMTVVIVIITVSVAAIFTLGKQYVAQAAFTKARTKATSIEEFQQLTQSAFSRYQDDVFAGAMAQTKLSQLQSMLGIKDPTKEDQDKFVSLAVQARQDAEVAIALDPSNPDAHATLANVFMLLAGVGFEDAENLANGKIEDAKWRDPLSPSYAMMSAYLAAQLNDNNLAREKVREALTLKNNFPEALFLLTQIDVKEGNIQSAVDTTRQIITLEPNNPTRHYQLGILLAANKDLDGAVTAYESAIKIDKNFANARYMLALAYLDQKRLEDALTQLRIVKETNKENKQLNDLISQLETGGLPSVPSQGLEGSVNEQKPNQENGDNITSPTNPDTDLVSPVNTAPTQTEGTAE